MAGSAAFGPLSGRPPTGEILVPTRACTSGEASRRWRTNTSTSSAMASPLSSRFHRRLDHSLSEHVPGLLHSFLTHGVQRRPQPRAGRHLRRTSFVIGDLETPVGWADSKRRPVRPLVHQHPFDGSVSMALIGADRARAMMRRPPAGYFTNAPGRYAGGSGDGGPLRVAAHGLKSSQHRPIALHLETNFHGPSPVQRDRLLTSSVRYILHLVSRDLVEARLDTNAAN